MEPDALYPVHAQVPWAREAGRVVVLLPKKLGPLARGIQRLTRSPTHLRVQLDDVGSRAFELSDGRRTAGEVARMLVDELGDQAAPPERALMFIRTLALNGMLRMAEEPVPAPPAPAGLPQVACAACACSFHTADPPGTRLRCPACRKPVRA